MTTLKSAFADPANPWLWCNCKSSPPLKTLQGFLLSSVPLSRHFTSHPQQRHGDDRTFRKSTSRAASISTNFWHCYLQCNKLLVQVFITCKMTRVLLSSGIILQGWPLRKIRRGLLTLGVIGFSLLTIHFILWQSFYVDDIGPEWWVFLYGRSINVSGANERERLYSSSIESKLV
jgi:hypothetical protein